MDIETLCTIALALFGIGILIGIIHEWNVPPDVHNFLEQEEEDEEFE